MASFQYLSDFPCNAPLKVAQPLPNATLLTLLLFIRHGVRSPALIFQYPGNEGHWKCYGMKNITKFPYVSVNGKPYTYSEYNESKKYVFPPSCERSGLLDEGIENVRELGRLYYNYSLMHNLFPPNDFDKALSLISFRSSNSPRCIESGISFLNGFFDQHDGPFTTTLNISVGESQNEPLLPSPFRKKHILDLLFKFLEHPDNKNLYDKLYNESEALLDDFRDYLNISYPYYDFESLTMGDLFNSLRCSNQDIAVLKTKDHKSPPENLMTPEKHRILMRNVYYLEGKFFNFSLPLPAGPIMKLIIEKLDKIKYERPEQMFNFFSAHSETLSALIAAFGIDKELPPPYRSHMLLEVWKPKDEQPVVRVIFNGEVEKTIPLKEFRKKAKDLIKMYHKELAILNSDKDL